MGKSFVFAEKKGFDKPNHFSLPHVLLLITWKPQVQFNSFLRHKVGLQSLNVIQVSKNKLVADQITVKLVTTDSLKIPVSLSLLSMRGDIKNPEVIAQTFMFE